MDRRTFLGQSLSSLFGASALFSHTDAFARLLESTNHRSQDPHFLLTIYLFGATDPYYGFNSRPHSLHAAGLQHDFSSSFDQQTWTDLDGESCLVHQATEALHPWRNKMAIINGVVMTPTFDGHQQNESFLFNGDPFSGENFVPLLNRDKEIDGLILGGEFPTSSTNMGKMVPVTAQSARELVAKIRDPRWNLNRNPMDEKVIRGTYARIQGEFGAFEEGSQILADAWGKSPGVLTKLLIPELGLPDQDATVDQTNVISKFFQAECVNSAILLARFGTLDTHALSDAMKQEEMYRGVYQQIALILKTLESTPYKTSGQSMLDCTTVMVVSEMGRSMRQVGTRIDLSGSDHNQFSNSVLLFGKGVRGGVITGSSDFHSPQEALSGAHLSLDPLKLKTFGLPYDFTTGRSTNILLPAYQAERYLTIDSLVNTIYHMFGVPQEKWRSLGRNLPTAPIIQRVLS